MREKYPTPYEVYIQLGHLRATWPPRRTDSELTVYVAGLQAVEFCLRMADGILDDTRPAALADERLNRVVDLVNRGLDLISSGLRRDSRSADVPAPGVALSPAAQRVLGRMPAYVGRSIEVRLGTIGAPSRDYDELVQPELVWALRPTAWEGPEDHLFRTVHQITECWLQVALDQSDHARDAANERRFWDAAKYADVARDALDLATATNDLLELMVPADFQRLRVLLRDGTAADSAAAREMFRQPTAMLGALEAELNAHASSLMAVLDDPSDDAGHHRYLHAVSMVAKRCQMFLCHHYLLVLDMLGVQTRGTLGREVENLAKHAVRPVVPQLNQARHDYALVTGLRFAPTSGTLVVSEERVAGYDPYPPAPEPEDCPEPVMRDVVTRYFEAIRDTDAEGWARLFDPEIGVMVDIPGTRPFVGRRKLQIFINSTFENFTDIHPAHDFRVVGPGVALVDWRMAAKSHLGEPVAFAGTELFTFKADGTLLRADADWDAVDVARQVWPEGAARTTALIPVELNGQVEMSGQ